MDDLIQRVLLNSTALLFNCSLCKHVLYRHVCCIYFYIFVHDTDENMIKNMILKLLKVMKKKLCIFPHK